MILVDHSAQPCVPIHNSAHGKNAHWRGQKSYHQPRPHVWGSARDDVLVLDLTPKKPLAEESMTASSKVGNLYVGFSITRLWQFGLEFITYHLSSLVSVSAAV
jgi:hypothetical protein